LAKYPFIQPIVLLLKYILRQRNLNETFTGGVSSYLLLNMSYAYVLYIQMQGNDIDESLKPDNLNLGSFFKGFLKFYSEEFNWRDLGISIRNGLQFFSKWSRHFSTNENLCFENFQEPDKDIARGAYQFPLVVKIFREILFKLHKAKIPSNHSYLSMFITITPDLKKRKLNLLDNHIESDESI
jgi:non-canonical poly(A) RNA polymerase PAPD5/7